MTEFYYSFICLIAVCLVLYKLTMEEKLTKISSHEFQLRG